MNHSRSPRRMKQLADRIDRIALADCKYLAARGRQYRVRAATAAEIEQMELTTGMVLMMPPGRKLFAIVKRVAVDACTCLRIYLENDADAKPSAFSEIPAARCSSRRYRAEALEAEAVWVEARL